MIKIEHYEVYTDKGNGWQLVERFAAEQRSDAFNLAKEKENENLKVKIIKEIFDVQDNTYQESVEYISTMNRRKHGSNSPVKAKTQESGAEKLPIVETLLSRASLPGAVLKLILLTVVSLVFAHLFVGLLFPLLEIFVPEDSSRSILFGVFFIVFLAMAIPLLLKSIPWYVFSARKSKPVKEEKFYERADTLVQAYNLNSTKDPIVATAYPEAPLEYRQYVVSYLSEVISLLQSQTVMKNSFSRLGIKLLVYGGCLELARYCGLTLAEANSVLYEAFKITDGDQADLEAFYEAKRSYQDNKVAVFLTGVGAYLMAQVINGKPMSDDLLNKAFDKWEAQNSSPHIGTSDLPVELEKQENLENDVVYKATLVSLKSGLKFMDSAMPNQEQTAIEVSAQIRNLVNALLEKYQGSDVVEADGITSVRFLKVTNALKFAVECLKDINTYQEKLGNDNLLMRNCCAVVPYAQNEEPNLSPYLADMFEHIYNNEIVVNKEIKESLDENEYHLEFLGEKNFANLKIAEELYKLLE